MPHPFEECFEMTKRWDLDLKVLDQEIEACHPNDRNLLLEVRTALQRLRSKFTTALNGYPEYAKEMKVFDNEGRDYVLDLIAKHKKEDKGPEEQV